MTTPSNFDAFFASITSGAEFDAWQKAQLSNQDLSDIESSIRSMDNLILQASTLTPSLTPMTTLPKASNQQQETTTPSIEIQRFTKIDGKPFGFEAVAGMDSLKSELQESFIKPLKFKFIVERLSTSSDATDPKTNLIMKLSAAYERFGVTIPTGMLFYGPPGTGKTFITKKLAEELGCGLIVKNMGEFGSSYLHQTTKNIKDFFAGARKASEGEPIILFLDEIDSLVSKRSNQVDANKAEEVSQFLQEFNTLETSPHLIVIAATNRPDHLDSAILRSGRLDKKIYLGPPDTNARKALFLMYIEQAGRPHETLDYDELAQLSDGYVSADIEAICDEVARDASHDLLELIDEAQDGSLTEDDLLGHEITMDELRKTIQETPSSLKMVDVSIYTRWIEQIKL